jgi:hypothetical protein
MGNERAVWMRKVFFDTDALDHGFLDTRTEVYF